MDHIRLKWYHTFVFLFQTILSLADIVTDALAAREYYNQREYVRFGLGVAFIVVPMIVTCLWSIVASTTRILHDQDADGSGDGSSEAVFSRGIVFNACLSCFCLGPSLHNLEMSIFCAKNFRHLWQSKSGIPISKERGSLYYLYFHTMNMKMVEGLLESAPQLILQVYAMLKQTEPVKPIQIVSASISLFCLTWTVTRNEELREHSGFNYKFLHTLPLFVSNLALVSSRSAAIVFFAVACGWWLAGILCAHWFIIVLLGVSLWTSKRRQDIFLFCFAYSVFYIFVFRSYVLRKIRGSVPLGRCQHISATLLWHVLFATENALMITLYYTKLNPNQPEKWYDMCAVVLVAAGTVFGLVIKSIMWCVCFRGHSDDGPSETTRPVTILLRGGRTT